MGVQRAGMGGGTHGMDCARQETGVRGISAALSQPRHAASAQLTIALAPQVGAQTHVRCLHRVGASVFGLTLAQC